MRVQYNTGAYRPVQACKVEYSTVKYSTVQERTGAYRRVQVCRVK